MTTGRPGAANVTLALTLLTALGSIQTAQDALNLMIGVLIVAIAGELVRQTRTSTLTHMSVEPKGPAKDGKL